MATKTTNLGLTKPTGTDAPDIDVINANMDLIDTAVQGKAASSHTHSYAGSSSVGGAATTALACTGNSATATKATQDSDGNVIADTYAVIELGSDIEE